MKHANYIIVLCAMFSVISCSKKENLDVDLSQYNADAYVPGEIDNWISTNLTNPYNIAVVYRFERSLSDVNKDIAPVKLEKVKPTMEMVLNGFLKPYEKIGGTTFIKTLTPKQFVLYGSVSYNTNQSVTLGTADGGRRVVLYDLNNLNIADGENIRKRLRTIHHEFTHVLNQNILIPSDFEQVSKQDYFADWTNAANTPAIAKSLGFISQYSRSSFGEDFAEMVSHLLVEGQVWFNNYINTTNTTAKARLIAKEKIVRNYFKTFFNIDFSALQAEVQKVLKETYGVTDPADITQTLPIWLLSNKVNNITYTNSAAHYTTYGKSTAFTTLYTNFRNEFRLTSPTWDINYFQFLFTSDSTMTFRGAFNTGTSTVYAGDFYFSMKIDPVSGEVRFNKVESGGLHYTANGSYLLTAFEKFMLPYLTNRTFIAAWLPATIAPSSSLYRTFGGFYVKGTPDNYFYGPIVLK